MNMRGEHKGGEVARLPGEGDPAPAAARLPVTAHWLCEASRARTGKKRGELSRRGSPQQARDYQRRAQFYLDFVEAENSAGFHADQESVRILGESVNFSRLGQLSLRGDVPPQPAG